MPLEHPFWNRHYTFNSEASAREMAVLGDSRISEILANVFFPFLVAATESMWLEYLEQKAALSNRRVETAATRLFGKDPRSKNFGKTVAHQQVLLQIYEDFCLQDNSDCAHMPLSRNRWPNGAELGVTES